LLKINNLIAKSKNGTEIIVSLIPLNKMQNTRQGFKQIEVGKRVLLESGIEVDLNLDGRTFYTSPNQLFKLDRKFLTDKINKHQSISFYHFDFIIFQSLLTKIHELNSIKKEALASSHQHPKIRCHTSHDNLPYLPKPLFRLWHPKIHQIFHGNQSMYRDF
jgi:hypothetical protein